MNRAVTVVGGLGLGAGLMYLLDPERRRRRVALVRDKADKLLHQSTAFASKAAKDVRNRAQGLVAETRHAVSEQLQPSDYRLAERVRSKIGRVVSHPGAIEVVARNGTVLLGGHVLKSEVDDLLSTVRAIKGVQEVEDQLDVHYRSENIPSLQGEPRPRADVLRRTLGKPAGKVIAGAAGASLAALAAWKLRGHHNGY